ncbi:unnamed protein product [Callosobruchus maculatus]|uniref:Uncharacterized protein n=1 Tax=Callosobruchus maculatus TaxID=64391 RepID=A0A653CM05_CALMS|nr:unnamed protein product [Callosobruchus maculatus]
MTNGARRTKKRRRKRNAHRRAGHNVLLEAADTNTHRESSTGDIGGQASPRPARHLRLCPWPTMFPTPRP